MLFWGFFGYGEQIRLARVTFLSRKLVANMGKGTDFRGYCLPN